jgi:Leucine-rich repeat (LRR) protein
MVDSNKGFTPINPKKFLQKVIEEEEKNGKKLSEEETVDLIFRGIGDLDPSINNLKNCRKLSLSSNFISRMVEIQLDKLEILSLGRNRIK